MRILKDPNIKIQDFDTTMILDGCLIVPLIVIFLVSPYWAAITMYLIISVVALAAIGACFGALDPENPQFRRMSESTVYISGLYKIAFAYFITMNIPATAIYLVSVAFLTSKYLSVMERHDIEYTEKQEQYALKKVKRDFNLLVKKAKNDIAKKAKEKREVTYHELPPE